MHASPPYTFAGLSFVYTPMKLGHAGDLPAPVRRRPVAGRGRGASDRWRCFWCRPWPHLLLEHPRFDTADLASVTDLHRRQRTAGTVRAGAAAGADAHRPGLQQLRHDRGRFGLLHHAARRGGQATGFGGQAPPPAEVRCADPDGPSVAAGEVGEVRMRIPGRPREYFGDPEATSRTWVDGWLVTGDLGRIDEDGYLYIVGRSKDVIIRGGNNIHPTDVEHAIESHPAVREVAVVGVPHPVLGEDVVAFVTLRPGQQATDEDLRAHTLEQLAKYKVPRQWYFVDELPRNATGKVVKDRLRSQLAEATGRTRVRRVGEQ